MYNHRPCSLGVTPPCGHNGSQDGCFVGFNVFAMEEEGLFADHPREVKALVKQLRQDPVEARNFIEDAHRFDTDIDVNGVVLTKNDLEQICLLLDKMETSYAWGAGHGMAI